MTFTKTQLRSAVGQLKDAGLTVKDLKAIFRNGRAWVSYQYSEGSTTCSDSISLSLVDAVKWLCDRELNYDFFLPNKI